MYLIKKLSQSGIVSKNLIANTFICIDVHETFQELQCKFFWCFSKQADYNLLPFTKPFQAKKNIFMNFNALSQLKAQSQWLGGLWLWQN